MAKVDFSKLLISVLGCQIIGFIGSLCTTMSVSTWYPSLVKPSFNPANWVFGPVWITLYFLMGVSLYIVWDALTSTHGSKSPIKYFIVQLILNGVWPFLFFGLRSPLLAFIEILVLWVFIVLTIISFYKVSKNSAYLLIPYVVWVTFAALINAAIVILN